MRGKRAVRWAVGELSQEKRRQMLEAVGNIQYAAEVGVGESSSLELTSHFWKYLKRSAFSEVMELEINL